jgi:uncharacterized repeat protein (TIGR01451 family)
MRGERSASALVRIRGEARDGRRMRLSQQMATLGLWMGIVGVAVMIGAGPAGGSHSHGTTERVSVDSAGIQGNSISGRRSPPALDADGLVVAFDSLASNLVPGDTNGVDDVFVHDRLSGETERVSLASDGTQGQQISVAPATSADGLIVAFESDAANLVPSDTNGRRDVFVRDRAAGTTERVSVASGGTQGDNTSFGASISADGRFVAFVSDASNLVPDKTTIFRDVYVHDRLTRTTERVSLTSAGTEARSNTTPPAISDDGRFVAFAYFGGDLVPDDTNGQTDVFVRDRLASTTERVSIDSAEAQAIGGGSFAPDISGDGRFVVYASDATNLVADDTNGVRDVFVRDRLAGTTERASVSSDEAQANSQSVGPGVRGGSIFGPKISADGRMIAFDSIASNLVAGDTNTCTPPALAPFDDPGECPDIFVRDRETGITHRVSIDGAGNQANHASTDPAISGDGLVTAFFSLASNLVAGDTNTCLVGLANFDDPGECPDIFAHDVSGRVISADLSVTKADSSDPARIGRPLTYTVIVANGGPVRATRVQLTDVLPPGVRFVAVTATDGACAESGGTVTCTIRSLPVGTTATVTIVVRPTRTGTITNTAELTGRHTDPNPANNTAVESTTVTR